MNQDVDIFAPEPDALDKAVTAFEENVPLAGQIAVGLTPAGIAVDVAEVGKYGRDALRDFSEGRVGSGLGNVGIAGLSALGLIPIIGDLAKAGGKSVIKRQFLQRTPEGRQKLGQQAGDDVRQIFDEPIPITEKVARMKSHPLLRSGSDKSLRMEPTTNYPGFGSAEFKDLRKFNFGDEVVQGYDNAVERLYIRARKMPYEEMGLVAPPSVVRGTRAALKRDKPTAVITIGLPGVGKSTVANPLAKKLDATIIDADEAKKVLPEYAGGIGANAVHQESKIIAEQVRALAMRNKDNLVLGKIGADYDALKRISDDLSNNGYRVVLLNVDAPLSQVAKQQVGRQFRTGRVIVPELFTKYTRKIGDVDTPLPKVVYNKLKKEVDDYAEFSVEEGLSELERVIEDTRGILKNL
tara:strand:+ start:1339 stop:2565 length:1227 start_codon:yes stop_codon:yes gene_type:complete